MDNSYLQIVDFWYGDKLVYKVYLDDKVIWSLDSVKGQSEEKTSAIAYFLKGQTVKLTSATDSEVITTASAKQDKIDTIKADDESISFSFVSGHILRLSYMASRDVSATFTPPSMFAAKVQITSGTAENGINADNVLKLFTTIFCAGHNGSQSFCEDLARTLMAKIFNVLEDSTSYTYGRLAKLKAKGLLTDNFNKTYVGTGAMITAEEKNAMGMAQSDFETFNQSRLAAAITSIGASPLELKFEKNRLRVVQPFSVFAYNCSQIDTKADTRQGTVLAVLPTLSTSESETFSKANSSMGYGIDSHSTITSNFIDNVLAQCLSAITISNEIEIKTFGTGGIILEPVQPISTYISEEIHTKAFNNSQKIQKTGGHGASSSEGLWKPFLWYLPIGDDVPLAEHEMTEEELQKDGNSLEIQQVYEARISTSPSGLEVY